MSSSKPIKRVRSDWQDVVLVCRKCSKRLDGGFGKPPLSSVNHNICSITGTITYAENSLTETLTNLTIAHDRQEIFGVGTNGTGLTQATFLNLN